MELTSTDSYRHLLEQISGTYTEGRVRAVQAVNTQLIETYWQVGGRLSNLSRRVGFASRMARR